MFNVNGYIRVDLDQEDKDRIKNASDTIQDLIDSILCYTGTGNGWTNVLEDANSVLKDILNGGLY